MADVFVKKDFSVRKEKGRKVFVKSYAANDAILATEEFAAAKRVYAALKSSSVALTPEPIRFDKNSLSLVFEYISGRTLKRMVHDSTITDAQLMKLFFLTGKALADFHKLVSKKTLEDIYTEVNLYGDVAVNNVIVNKEHIYFIDFQPLPDKSVFQEGPLVFDLVKFVMTFKRHSAKNLFSRKRNVALLESAFLKGYVTQSAISFNYGDYAREFLKLLNSTYKSKSFTFSAFMDVSLKRFYRNIVFDKFSYTKRYQDKRVAKTYDLTYENKRNVHTLIWNMLEKDLFLSSLKKYARKDSYMDFATGTGRVLKESEHLFNAPTGWDISQEMLDLAKNAVSKASLKRIDIFAQSPTVLPRFDCVTAFRFFLNSDNSLRYSAAFNLSFALKKKGILVFNVHANKSSYMYFHLLFSKLFLRRSFRLLSRSEVKRILSAAGLRIKKEYGYGYLPRAFYFLLGKKLSKRIEKFLSELRLPFASHKLYVVEVI